ncbi:hypothetical protein NCS56_00660800 [Fusarium sp. Ph1]|nr:hypothetical protein NCS56_00660800 [Fusarium sp. Ph1]
MQAVTSTNARLKQALAKADGLNILPTDRIIAFCFKVASPESSLGANFRLAVSGAISIAALFNKCVDCFEYIQIARNFRKDYGRCQLRLDVAKWRLDRWGAAIDINNDPRFRSGAPTDESVAHAPDTLREIAGRIEWAYKVSRRSKQTTPEQDWAALTQADLDPASQRVRNQFEAITKKRQDRTSLIKKTGWALYDKKRLGSLIGNIVSSIDELELIFPSAAQASIQLDAANGLDPVLNGLAKQKLVGVEIQNFATRVKTAEAGKLEVGNIFTNEAFGQSVGFPYSATNRLEDIEAKEDSGVLVGDTYGGKGFWG